LAEQTQTLAEQRDAMDRKNIELNQAQLELEDRAEELQRSSKYKSEFLANMSHELRTPLNSSLILAKLLAENPQENLSAEQVKFAESIYSAGNDLLNLINDILDISKVEAGKLEVRPENSSVARLVDGLRGMFEPLASDRKLGFQVEVQEGAPAMLFTDRQRLEQILKNLLSNAIKFTEQGQVSLSVSGAAEGGIVFTVRDSGIGIAPDQQESIFEAFRQADGTTNRRYGGTGLGLSISRDLATLLGGSIHVTSEPGKGSVFTLTLPEQYKMLKTARSRDKVFEGRKILLVDDDVRNIFALTSALEHKGAVVVIGRNGREAIDRLNEVEDIDLVLMDVMMPEMDGYEATALIRQDPRWKKLPIIAVTAKAMKDDQERCLAAGSNDYLAKPIDLDRLFSLIRVWLPKMERI
ncbi:hypothetical protein CLOP_g7605, partial [Closterium sp. NIES-67]